MHRNPRIGMGSITSGLKTGMGVGLGIVVTNFATGLVVKKVAALPKSLTEGLGLTALKIGIGAIAVPMLLRAVKQHKLAGNVAIGAWAAVAVDLYGAYVQPQLAAAGLGEYEPGSLQDYQPASLQGDESSVDLSGTLYEGGVYD